MSSAWLSLFLFALLSPAWAAEEKPQPATVFVAPVRSVEIFEQLAYPARVTSKVNTTLLSESDGVVSKVYAPLGQSLKRKTRVFKITHTDPVYQYAPVTITSPVSGVISSVDVTEGTHVIRGQRLATVTDPARMRLVIEVPSQDLALLRAGDRGEFRLSAASAPIPVRVTGLSPFVDPATGTATCELEPVDVKGASTLRPGLIGRAEFKAGVHQGVQIPDHAIVYKGSTAFIRVLDGGKAKFVAATFGRKQRGLVEVLEGLKEGDRLIERSSRYVGDGDAVTVQDGDRK